MYLKVHHITQNGLLVCARSNKVLHHVLLLAEITVKLEVLGGRRFFGALRKHGALLARFQIVENGA